MIDDRKELTDQILAATMADSIIDDDEDDDELDDVPFPSARKDIRAKACNLA
jgi:hypothetical protein